MSTSGLTTLSMVIAALQCFGDTNGAANARAAAFQQGIMAGFVTSSYISEAGGMAASWNHPGYLYVIKKPANLNYGNGYKPEVHLISSTNGSRVATLTLTGANVNGFKDIAVGRCSYAIMSAKCIYILAKSGLVDIVYQVQERYIIEDSDMNYPDMAEISYFSWHGTYFETVMVDPQADVYVISKATNGKAVIGKIPNSAFSGSDMFSTSLSANGNISIQTHHKGPVSGDISPDGKEVLLMGTDSMYYWKADGTHDYVTLLSSPGTPAPFAHKHPGTTVCWDVNGKGYFTLAHGPNEPLYHYLRSWTNPAVGR